MFTSASDYIIRGIKNLTDGITSAVSNLGETIISGVKEIFVPDEDFLSDKMAYVSEKFSFVSTVFDTVDIILGGFGVLNELKPPVVTMDLGNADSIYNYGGECVVLDLSWYAPYKPVVDMFLRSILWVFFIWRMFVALPNIISGVSGDMRLPRGDVPRITMKRR